MKPSECLIAAKALISTPDKWTKCALARDKDGKKCHYSQAEVICFCTLGAIGKVAWGILENSAKQYHMLEGESLRFLRRAVRQATDDFLDVAEFNDKLERTHEDIMKMFDNAIVLAQEFEASKDKIGETE